MEGRLAFKCLLVVLVVVLLGVDAKLPHHLRWNKLRRHRDLEHEKLMLSKEASVPEDQYFTQKLCHFNPNVTGTWRQRFWQNDAYYTKDNGIQFLNIGGEGEESPYVIYYEIIPMVAWAKKLGARLWNLEHRYYGKSRPLKDQSVENLFYLNGRQALEDLADFIKAKNAELNIKNPKWVVFGGSYPGALALWFRQWHPELTVGAVGSSAPVELVTDFFDYLRVCEDSYRTYDQKCADNIKAGFDSMHKLLDTKEGRDQLDSAFGLDPPLAKQDLTYTNLQNFWMTITGNFMVAVQYSRVNAGVFKTDASIPDVCNIMTSTAINAVARLVKVNSYINQVFGGDPSSTDDSYDEQVQALSDESFDSPYASDRSWVWQTCNEFGYFQSTAYNGIFGEDVPVNYYYNLCSDVYGDKFTVDYIRGRVQRSIDNFGVSTDYNATNVVIPNGSLDPWHSLGTYVQKNPTAIPYLIEGTAHCADMEPPSDKDPQGLKDVRDLIFSNLKTWTGASVEEPKSRAERVVVKEQEIKPEQTPKQRPALLARRAPDFETEICWNCGKPKNEHVKHRKPPAEVAARFEHRVIGGRPVSGGFLGKLKKDRSQRLEGASVSSSYISQPIDHFNTSDKRTYNQVFFTNDQYYKDGGPIFVFIGGESAADQYWISSKLPLTDWAKKYNAMLFEVEHRFYGDSQPFPSMTMDSLKYLTSEQALADLATFIKQVNKDKGWTNPRWIPYGGSYAGSLTAWFRELYPDITFAAVGSSGPVQADVDFYGYLQTVESALRSSSDECADNLKAGFDKVHELFTTVEGRAKLNDQMQVTPAFDDNPIDIFSSYAFFSDILNPIMGNVQYSDEYDGVPYICEQLTDSFTRDPVDRLQNAKGGGPTYWNMQEILDYFEYDGDTRAWFWQTCNEFGFYQSSDIGRGAFGSALPVNFYLRWCSDPFDASLVRDKLEKSMNTTNLMYGGSRNYHSSKVVQLYGTIDPWHSIGYYGDTHGDDVVSILINGTSHCSDMTRSGDPDQINKALKQVETYLDKWLN